MRIFLKVSCVTSTSSQAYDGDFWFSAWPPRCPWGRCVLISIDLEQENTEQIGTGPRLSQIQELTWNTAQNTFTFYILGRQLTAGCREMHHKQFPGKNIHSGLTLLYINTKTCCHICLTNYFKLNIPVKYQQVCVWGVSIKISVSNFFCLAQSFVSNTLHITQGHSADLGALTWILLTIFLL